MCHSPFPMTTADITNQSQSPLLKHRSHLRVPGSQNQSTSLRTGNSLVIHSIHASGVDRPPATLPAAATKLISLEVY